MKMKSKEELMCCPYCSCEEYYFKEKYKGQCNHYKHFIDDEIVTNEQMYSSAEHTLASVYAYCFNCHQKVFKIPKLERY